jgi:FAD:protein FMN transferase
MGSEAHLISIGPSREPLDVAERQIRDLEAKWSRFLPDSELVALNRSGGRLVMLSAATFAVVVRAVEAWWATGGLFDPTILDALERAGYDQTFAEIPPQSAQAPRSPIPSPGCAAIEFEPALDAVRLPLGTRLDLGGIGKGFAADLVVGSMLDAGATGACVNLGGDLRVCGVPPDDHGWVVDVDGRSTVALSDGAVATTSRSRRRWRRGAEECHHLIDPLDGVSVVGDLTSVSVVAADGATAEVLAKAVFVAGADAAPDLLSASGAAALLAPRAGTLLRVGGYERFEVTALGTSRGG